MNEMYMTVTGNVGQEPELKVLESGTKVVTFSVANTPRRFDQKKGGWVDGDTSWVHVTAWRGMAENVAASIHKGQRVVVHGRFAARVYTTAAEESRVVWELEAAAVGHDLSVGTSVFSKRTTPVSTVERDENGAPKHPGVFDGHRLAGPPVGVTDPSTGSATDEPPSDDDPFGADLVLDEPESEFAGVG